MRQRVGFARALVVHPNILLMDEPFSALDVLTAETLRTDFLELWGDGKLPIKGVILVTHNIEEAVLMCDRILLFSSNPGRIIREIAVDLKQPRNRLDTQFRDLVEKIYVAMTARTPTPPKIGDAAGTVATSINTILPRVSANLLSGLLETLAAEYNGKADLPVFADEQHLEGDDLFPVADALQMLHLAEIEGGDIKLTDIGKQFVDAAPTIARRFSSASFSPTCRSPRTSDASFRSAPITSRPKSRFFDELEDHMSTEDAEETLRSVTAWGRYAEAFAYDDDTQTFSLENPT